MKRLKCNIPKLFLRMNGIKYGRNLSLYGWGLLFRFPNAEIEIGDDVTLRSSFLSNLIGLYQRCIIIARGEAKIHIGNHVGMSGVTLYARKDITIGENTIIGANTKILDNDFHSLDVQERIHDIFEHLICEPIKIGNNVFIGCNCIILKGTQLGDNCIVGAGSVVQGRYEDNCVVAGNPAKIIKKITETGETV